MPLYEYECKKFHGIFEVRQSINDPPLDKCPQCVKEKKKSGPPKRLISLGAFQLKGGGWAKDNYK